MPEKIKHLINLCKKGEQKAQMQVYDLYSEAMYFIATRYLINEEEAKDAMQEGFLKAFLKIDMYEDQLSFGAWLKRIIINQCIDVLKKKKLKTISLEKYPLEIVDDTIWDFDVSITKEMILSAINKLTEKYRLVTILYLIEGYDHTEISGILKIPIKTSRTHLRRGKLQLQTLLKEKRYEARY